MVNRSNATSQPETGRPDVARPCEEMRIVDDLTQYFERYARERPQTLALICLGVGFVLGWKLKPW
jgi:hypothetical protein